MEVSFSVLLCVSLRFSVSNMMYFLMNSRNIVTSKIVHRVLLLFSTCLKNISNTAELNRGRFTPVSGALDCGAGGLGFDSRGRSNTLGLSQRN